MVAERSENRGDKGRFPKTREAQAQGDRLSWLVRIFVALFDGAIVWVMGLEWSFSILAAHENYSGVFTTPSPRPHPSLVRSGGGPGQSIALVCLFACSAPSEDAAPGLLVHKVFALQHLRNLNFSMCGPWTTCFEMNEVLTKRAPSFKTASLYIEA